MSFSCVIDKDRRLVIVTASGRLTFSDLREIQQQLTQDPAFDPAFDLLTDLTAVTSFDISVDEARAIARTPVFSPASRRATVASEPSVFGMGRLMQAHREIANLQFEAGVFYERDAALKWLSKRTV